jgi:hypothetical protein
VRRAVFIPVSPLLVLACGPGTPVGDDEIGETSTDTSSSSESESSASDTTTETETTETETTDTETTDTETGDVIPVCEVEAPESLWSLSCDRCARIQSYTNPGLITLTLVGSQIPDDHLVCGHFQFEGTVMEHPSPDEWVFDACPCDQDCEQPDPHTLDLSGGDWPDPGPHPMPELLPADLGQCVRVDVFKSGTVGGIDTACRPQAVALWSLDGDTPVLRYAQGGSNDYEFPIDLGDLDIDAKEDCAIEDETGLLLTTTYTFTLDGISVDVPEQASAMFTTAGGDYEARNIIGQIFHSNVSSEASPWHWWAVYPAP